jgi:uncharacterized membrane protein
MKIVIIIPTYNEKENIGLLLDSLQTVFKNIPHKMHILVVDDNSPDSTGDVVRAEIKKCRNIHLITGDKKGLGTAYIRGMRYAVDQLNADVVMEMDADFSHNPDDVPRMIAALEDGIDFVIGSRYVSGGSIPSNWGVLRKMISKWGNIVSRYITGLNTIRDCTSGFRAIRASVIKKINLENLAVQGYAFQIALLHQAICHHAVVKEIPIEFIDRIRGEAKLGISDITEFIIHVLGFRLERSWDCLKKAFVKKGCGIHGVWLYFLIGALLTTGIFFRFYNLDKKVYWYDEVHTSLWISGHTWPEVRQLIGGREIDIRELQQFQSINHERGLLKTISSLSKSDPQHPPLYYGLVRLWADLFGDSISAVRSFSVFAGLLVFPFLFWFCRELFKDDRVAWISVILVAVSPFHVLYAQEARQYSLWTVTILFSSAALLRALRMKTISGWSLYSVAIAIGIYTHTLFLLVIAAHGVYVFGNYLSEIYWKPFRLPKILVFYIGATLAGLIVFMPWAYCIIANFSRVEGNLSWLTKEGNPFYLMGMWGFNFSSIFYDADHTYKALENFNMGVLLSYFIRVLMLILAAYSTVFIYIKKPKHIWLNILTLIFVPFLLLALPDLLYGGRRSGWGIRFLIPCYVGVEVAVAYLLSKKMVDDSLLTQKIWKGIAAVVIACGIVSCGISSQAERWWNKGAKYNLPQLSSVINRARRPLLIINPSGTLLSFSHLLKSETRIYAPGTPDTFHIPKGFRDVFVFRPSSAVRKKIEQENGFKLERVDTKGGLWRLTKQL